MTSVWGRLREERGYTQAELAEKIGIIQTIISAIETDTLKLSAEMAIRFALALEVSTDDLLLPVKRNGWAASPAAGCCAAWNRSRRCPHRSSPCCSRPSIRF